MPAGSSAGFSLWGVSICNDQTPQAEACATENKAFARISKNYPNLPGWRVERTNSRSADTLGP
jgi:hypothetical protein